MPAGYRRSARGIGLADMARAETAGTPHRASGLLGLHVVDAMTAITQGAHQQSFVELTTTLERPAPVPYTIVRDSEGEVAGLR